ncbi:MAG TPA: hypothetical protein VFQ77_15350 [Pseudonocardiaceae bacterium]|jgi:hypothetical protein|nr:hypothetical protein [Pseudonocardiaceae bacterium]
MTRSLTQGVRKVASERRRQRRNRHDRTPGGWKVGLGQAGKQIMLRVRP